MVGSLLQQTSGEVKKPNAEAAKADPGNRRWSIPEEVV